jgi:hypothetical protein
MVGSDESTALTPRSLTGRALTKLIPYPTHVRAVLILACLTCTTTAFAEIFKWTDAKGRIHYGDQLPPEQVEKEHNELTKSGVTTKSIDRNKTAEERAKEENQKKKLDEEQAARTERDKNQGVRDRALLETYFNETDLIRMRDQRVATIEGTIKVTQNNLESMQTQVKLLEEEVSAQPENSETRKKSQTKLSNAKSQLASYEKFISNKREEQTQIRRQFDTDLSRFRELRGDPKEVPKVTPQQQSNAPAM